jgi:hypothetical protein
MSKSRKRTRRGAHYRALAEGYAMLKSPLAGSFYRAAEHYDQTDQPVAAPRTRKIRRSRKNASERRLPRYYVFQSLIDKRRAPIRATAARWWVLIST